MPLILHTPHIPLHHQLPTPRHLRSFLPHRFYHHHDLSLLDLRQWQLVCQHDHYPSETVTTAGADFVADAVDADDADAAVDAVSVLAAAVEAVVCVAGVGVGVGVGVQWYQNTV
eukprot:TRINITY_DN12193_c1_g1_i1.p1 TRINITY_DN12193_c1_g1~~TRINITY_DN12193_c1_g1_i1.p1  ORF type:complete len:114 (-),score=21.49 TRINITY_DN12193_c1_g1_i1:123-464(-)